MSILFLILKMIVIFLWFVSLIAFEVAILVWLATKLENQLAPIPSIGAKVTHWLNQLDQWLIKLLMKIHINLPISYRRTHSFQHWSSRVVLSCAILSVSMLWLSPELLLEVCQTASSSFMPMQITPEMLCVGIFFWWVIINCYPLRGS